MKVETGQLVDQLDYQYYFNIQREMWHCDVLETETDTETQCSEHVASYEKAVILKIVSVRGSTRFHTTISFNKRW